MKLVNSGGVNSKLIVDTNEQVHSPSMLHITINVAHLQHAKYSSFRQAN
jgi:hypothetical protein